MSSFAYKEMEPELENMSIFRRLRRVDYRVWFFIIVVGSISFDVTKLEYLVQYGFKINTAHIPAYMILNGVPLYAAVSNNFVALKLVNIYSTLFLLTTAIIATLAPVWMIFAFNNGAPEQIRLILEHGDTHDMEFRQRLGYCALLELTLLFDAAYYALQMFLTRKVLLMVIDEEKAVSVEMDAFNVV